MNIKKEPIQPLVLKAPSDAAKLKPNQALVVELDSNPSVRASWHIDSPFGKAEVKTQYPTHQGPVPPSPGMQKGTLTYRWEPEQIKKAIRAGQPTKVVASLTFKGNVLDERTFNLQLEPEKS